MVGLAFPARAELERMGPISVDPRIGGFPAWYQDKTGVALEFCAPLNDAEVAGGHCLLLPGDVVVPEHFPDNFFDEHFYYAGEATLSPANGGKALLVTALESAFAAAVVPGDQIVFTRIRVRLDPLPATGTYRFIHPFGEESLAGAAGDRIFFTDDVGIGSPGVFDGALHSRLGPFLKASATAGGAELPPVAGPVAGKLYLADPGRSGPVTGSVLPDFTDSTGALRNHNIFRIEGPAGSNLGGPGIDFIETTNFTLMGRLYTDVIAGRVGVNRASYTNDASGFKLDVFAKGEATTQGRVPAQPRPAAVVPQLSYFEAACAVDAAGVLAAPPGLTSIQMQSAGSKYWGQSIPAAIPAQVCVKDAAARNATGAIVPAFFDANVTDEVAVTLATYDPGTDTLSVNATSSDTIVPPILTVQADEIDASLAAGQVAIPLLLAPPAKVRVVSSYGGSAELLVTTAPIGVAPPTGPAAVNDSFIILEDAAATAFAVLANDTNATGGTVTLLTQPRLGSAIVNLDGSVSYTPSLNANGSDAFTYQVAVGTLVSNIATVAIAITPVNDLTTAVNDGPFVVQAGITTALPNVLDNDLDVDGRADLVDAVDVTVTTPGAVVTGGAGGIVTFLAGTPGNYTFTYRALDRAGVRSNVATVIVQVIGGDTVVGTDALFRIAQRRWTISGSASQPNQTVTIKYDDGAAAGTVIGTAQVDPFGNWLLDLRKVTGALDPTTLTPRPTRVRITSTLGGTTTVPITIR
ncbi:MAG: Ig-like domain-containing protein [Myxococcales bacterium]